MCRVLLARRYKDKTTRTIYTDTDYPIKDAARPHNLDTTATTKRITKLDILLFHAFAE